MGGVSKDQIIKMITNKEGLADKIIKNLDLSGLSLDGADFSGAKLINCSLSFSSLKSAIFSQTYIKGVDFSDSNCEEANFSNADISATTFLNARLNQAKFTNGTIIDTLFLGAVLKKCSFSGASLEGVNFTEVLAAGVNLESCIVKHSNFWRADLTGSNLRGGIIKKTNLENAILNYSDFSGAQLADTKLYGAELAEASISGTDFGDELYYEKDQVIQENSAGKKIIGKDFSKAMQVYKAIIDNYIKAGNYCEARIFYIRFMDALKHKCFYEAKIGKWLVFYLWRKICLYGENVARFFKMTIGQLVFFAFLYYGIIFFLQKKEGLYSTASDGIISALLSISGGSIISSGNISDLLSFFEPAAVIQVMILYALTGAFMTILARKMFLSNGRNYDETQ